MTVLEMIEALREFPPDARVAVRVVDLESGDHWIEHATPPRAERLVEVEIGRGKVPRRELYEEGDKPFCRHKRLGSVDAVLVYDARATP